MVDVSDAVREAVLLRDDYTCQVCNRGANMTALHLHHVLFRSQGGTHDIENLVALCWACHERVHRGFLRVARYEVSPGVWQTFWERTDVDQDD